MNNCTICKSSRTKKMIDWKEYNVNICQDCEVVFALPLPSDDTLREFYQGFMFNKPEKEHLEKLAVERKAELRRLFAIEGEVQQKTFLDYGGGTGSAYGAAKELGLEAYYHDLDQEAKQFVMDVYGLSPAYVVDKISDCNQSFDYIFSDNVIEHVKDPIDYLQGIKSALKNGGQIVIKTPHARNTAALFMPLITVKGYFRSALKYNSVGSAIKSYVKRLWHCDPPRHLYSFSKANLTYIAQQAGFVDSQIEVLHYEVPFLKYSLTESFLKFKKLTGVGAVLTRLLMLLIIPFELCTRVAMVILLRLGVLSPGGIVLRLHKSK